MSRGRRAPGGLEEVDGLPESLQVNWKELRVRHLRRPTLVKILIHGTDTKEGARIVNRLVRKYKPKTAQFFVHLNHQQISALKKHYQGRISLIHGELLWEDRYDKPPP